MIGTAKAKPAKGTAKRQKAAGKRKQSQADKLVYVAVDARDGLRCRIDEATKYVPLEQIALSPQCGFASDIVGNKVSEDDQRRKLSLLAETARLVWG